MRLGRWLILAVLAGLLGAGIGWTYYRSRTLAVYQTASITRGNIDATVAATGTCNAVVTVQVGSQVSGNIKTLYADFNTKVTKGQLVALIDPEMFQAQVNQAQANLDSARDAVINAQAAAAKAEADVANAVAAVESAKAQVAKAQSDLQNAQVNLDRDQASYDKGVLDKQDLDNAQATRDSDAALLRAAQAQVNAAQAAVRSAEAAHDVTLAQIETNEGQVRQNEAALEQAKLNLLHTKIIAPVDGIVIARFMDVGQTVAASFQAPTIFEIAQDLAKMQVDTNVDEADVGGVRVGQSATFAVDAFPGRTFSAVVSQIRKAPINVQNVITYDVVLTVDNSDLKLFPGMTANVRILIDTARDVVRAPNAAFRFKLPGAPSSAHKPVSVQTIYTLDSQGRPQPVEVSTGLTDGNFTVVTGPLKPGDRVIVGTASKATPSAAAPAPRGPSF